MTVSHECYLLVATLWLNTDFLTLYAAVVELLHGQVIEPAAVPPHCSCVLLGVSLCGWVDLDAVLVCVGCGP